MLKLLQNQTWGFVCDTFFSKQDAQVFCREIGKELRHNYHDGVPFAPQTNTRGPFFANGLDCDGTEESYTACRGHNSYTPCESRNAASVICFQFQGNDLRIEFLRYNIIISLV